MLLFLVFEVFFGCFFLVQSLSICVLCLVFGVVLFKFLLLIDCLLWVNLAWSLFMASQPTPTNVRPSETRVPRGPFLKGCPRL